MGPRWSRDGAQLFYISNDTLMVTRIFSAGDELVQATPASGHDSRTPGIDGNPGIVESATYRIL